MFDHIDIRVADLDASRAFYTAALGEPTHDDDDYTGWGNFDVAHSGTVSEGLHVAWGATDRAAVDAWWERMTSLGYRDNGSPGTRPQYNSTYYGAFVLDPDGNNVERVHHDRTRPDQIDHLWLRTADLLATKRFYDTVAPIVGIDLVTFDDTKVRYTDGVGSFTFILGDELTRHVHLAFGVSDQATVDAFHAAALEAGYADNGAPGERPQYHPGYYGAFVFDPDGNNVEAVFHDRR
ncbi:MAG TPA: VOC family protein [Gaiellaceae bacterium]|nr:VOC family protein [Gaiellaceae bacterium]